MPGFRGALAALTVLLLPLAGAQAGPSGGCVNECTPWDPGVNDRVHTGSEITRTVLYAHVQDILNRAPLNTQPPSSKEPDIARGFLMPTVVAGPQPVNVAFDNAWFHWFSSSGPVEVVDGQWRTHQTPGLAEPLHLHGDTMNLYVYVSTAPQPGAQDNPAPLSVMPLVGVRGRVESGRHAFGDESILIAEGDTGARDDGPLPTGPGRATLVALPGVPSVYEIQVPLRIRVHTIPSAWQGGEGFLVSYNLYQIRAEEAPAGGARFAQAEWLMHAGPSTPPRLVVDVVGALVDRGADVTRSDGLVFARWNVSSPFGAYDVDTESFRLAIQPPGDAEPVHLAPHVVKYNAYCGGQFEPVRALFRLDVEDRDLPDGVYTFHASVLNGQGTYRLERTEEVLVVGDTVTRLA